MEITTTINDPELREYVTKTKLGMLDLEFESELKENEKTRKQCNIFNKLEDWEKNMLIIYTYFGSYKKMESCFNVKQSTIRSIVLGLIEKCRNQI